MKYFLATSYYITPEHVCEKLLAFAQSIPEIRMPISKGNGTIEFEKQEDISDELFAIRILERLKPWLQESDILASVAMYKDSIYVLSYRKRR